MYKRKFKKLDVLYLTKFNNLSPAIFHASQTMPANDRLERVFFMSTHLTELYVTLCRTSTSRTVLAWRGARHGDTHGYSPELCKLFSLTHTNVICLHTIYVFMKVSCKVLVPHSCNHNETWDYYFVLFEVYGLRWMHASTISCFIDNEWLHYTTIMECFGDWTPLLRQSLHTWFLCKALRAASPASRDSPALPEESSTWTAEWSCDRSSP